MALTTYSELKAAIASRLHRTDLTTDIVDFITLAEKSLNHTLGLSAQETEATLTATVSSRTLTPPSLFGAPVALYLTTYLPRQELGYQLPSDMQVYSDNGEAGAWTIDGALIKTDRPADIAYTYTLRYVAEFDLAATLTNSLLTNYPDLYLFGSLIEAADHIRDDASMARYQQRYARALQECKDNENANRSIAKLSTEFGSRQKQNIISGG